MGLSVDAEETEYKIDFEIRQESVVFYGDDSDETMLFAYGNDCIEIDKKYLKKIILLLQDSYWHDKIFE